MVESQQANGTGKGRKKKTTEAALELPPTATRPTGIARMDIARQMTSPAGPRSTARPSSSSAASRRGPISGYSRPVLGPHGDYLGEVGEGNRKDIRNAVEAAHAASGWASATGHLRAQILYYLAENLSTRAEEFAATHRQHDRLRAR